MIKKNYKYKKKKKKKYFNNVLDTYIGFQSSNLIQ